MLAAFRVVACLTSLSFGAGESTRAAKEEMAATAVQLFDAGGPSPTLLAPDAVAGKIGWAAVPEGEPDHSFKGDAALVNGHLALVLRRNGRGAELYATGPKRSVLCAVLQPTAASPAAKRASVKVLENSHARVAVEAAFEGDGGKRMVVRFELRMGQPFVATEARGGATALRLQAPCRFAILPDFFADDIVVDATTIAAETAEIPCENLLLHLICDGDAILVTVSADREKDALIELSGRGKQRVVAASTIPYGKEGKIWVAAIADKGAWHVRDVAELDADQVLALDWKAPFPAQWRVDWRLDDGFGDSWEMLVQKPDGSYAKPDWFGQSDRVGVGDWMKSGRWRWTTGLGSFQYPCWIDKDSQGFLQPLKRMPGCQGPALVYPINRLPATPLDRFTLVDLVRETLGVGPCEYVLDVEGQRKVARGTPTCPTRSMLDAIYSQKQQKEKRAEVEKALDDVLAFVQQIRGRIEAYAAFGRDLATWLEEQKRAKPELADSLTQMQAALRRIEAAVELRRKGIRAPGDAVALVHDFRTNLVGYDGPDALGRCKKITAALVDIGDNQDELVCACRAAVKILRQQAGLMMAADTRMGDIAREIRRRTQAILRAPAGVEAPRH